MGCFASRRRKEQPKIPDWFHDSRKQVTQWPLRDFRSKTAETHQGDLGPFPVGQTEPEIVPFYGFSLTHVSLQHELSASSIPDF